MRPTVLLPILLSCLVTAAQAYEMRTWTNADGKTVEAELVSFDGEKVTIKNKAGKRFTFEKTKLSQNDLAYLDEYATVKKDPFGSDGKKNVRVANPAMDAKIDKDTFKEGGEFEIPDAKFEILKTPHFKIMHTKKAKPDDLAELAERLWIDTAFFHQGFDRVFTDRKMAVFLVDEETTYLAIGEWYASLLEKEGHDRAANNVRATWERAAAGTVILPSSIADANGVLKRARVFRTYKSSGNQGRPEKIRGVWVPFRVHCLAGDLLDAHTGGVSRFASQGWYALSTGYSYYKEVKLAEKSETSILSADSVADVTSTGGFTGSEDWPDELRDVLRKEKIEPKLEMILGLDAQSAKPLTNVLAYSFAYFLQSTPERTIGWSALMERISTSNQVPPPDDMAQLLGFENAADMEKQWVEFIKSRRFK